MVLSQAPVGFTWMDSKLFATKIIYPRCCIFSSLLSEGVCEVAETDFTSFGKFRLTYLPIGLV